MRSFKEPVNEKEPPRRRGRPRLEDVGLADERILAAASELFLRQGFARTSVDQVCAISGSGKSTVYGRYATKGDLFGAVVMRSIAAIFTDFPPTNLAATPKERVRAAAQVLAARTLIPRCISLMRMTAAEADAFPELAKNAYDVSFAESISCIAAALAGACTAEELHAARPLASRFIELAFQPIFFQATFGGPLPALRRRSKNDIDEVLEFLVSTGQIPR